MPWFRFKVANHAYVLADTFEHAEKVLKDNPTGVGGNWGTGVREIEQGAKFWITDGKKIKSLPKNI